MFQAYSNFDIMTSKGRMSYRDGLINVFFGMFSSISSIQDSAGHGLDVWYEKNRREVSWCLKSYLFKPLLSWQIYHLQPEERKRALIYAQRQHCWQHKKFIHPSKKNPSQTIIKPLIPNVSIWSRHQWDYKESNFLKSIS